MATDLSRVPAEVRERIRELEEELKEGGPVAAGGCDRGRNKVDRGEFTDRQLHGWLAESLARVAVYRSVI